MTPILLVGGAPRVRIDAVRHLTVHATGATVVALARALEGLGRRSDSLLSQDAAPTWTASQRYTDRAELDAAVGAWVRAHPLGVVVMSAAVNDYEVVGIELDHAGVRTTVAPGTKMPSRADEVVIRLRPAPKLIDRLRSEWGFCGRLVGFKYEDAMNVVASAQALRMRCQADLVVANSLCGQVQVLVDSTGSTAFPDRGALITALAAQIAQW